MPAMPFAFALPLGDSDALPAKFLMKQAGLHRIGKAPRDLVPRASPALSRQVHPVSQRQRGAESMHVGDHDIDGVCRNADRDLVGELLTELSRVKGCSHVASVDQS